MKKSSQIDTRDVATLKYDCSTHIQKNCIIIEGEKDEADQNTTIYFRVVILFRR